MSNNYEQWYLVVGDGVNARFPAADPDEAARIAASVAGVEASTLRVYCRGGAFRPISVECWHTAQLLK